MEELSAKIARFIQENIYLIEAQEWDKLYNQKHIPLGVTEAMLAANINPLQQGLNYIPHKFLCRANSIKSFEIPDHIKRIEYEAFHDCTNLTSITIPDSVTSIEEYAFYNCISLTNVIIPNSVTSISYCAFDYCISLTNVTIPNSVTSIGEWVFFDCKKLTQINYLGTKKEALTKLKVRNKRWREDSSIKKIICTDGEIDL